MIRARQASSIDKQDETVILRLFSLDVDHPNTYTTNCNMSDQVAKVDSKSPYQLDLPQTTQACKVLLTQIRKQDANASKPNLLAADGEDDEEPTEVDEAPVWMVVNTKKHIVDQKRLKPNKM